MKKSVFDIEAQQKNLSSKVVVGLERIAEVFKTLLWDQAKATGLSPIQIQILVFINYHKPELCKVSYLAQEFNVTKPTISDAVKVLLKKDLVKKMDAGQDSRSYLIGLTGQGRKMVVGIEQFAAPIDQQIEKLDEDSLSNIYQSLASLILQLNKSGILSVQRTCLLCRFYEKKPDGHYCHFLEQDLKETDIRIDCPEFEPKSS